jgi:hypothetical protein
MLASEIQHQLADAFDTTRSPRDSLPDHHPTKKWETGALAICAWGTTTPNQEDGEGRRGRETSTGLMHSLLRVVDLPGRRMRYKGTGRSRANVSVPALRRDGIINTDHSRSGPRAGP